MSFKVFLGGLAPKTKKEELLKFFQALYPSATQVKIFFSMKNRGKKSKIQRTGMETLILSDERQANLIINKRIYMFNNRAIST